ncbi:MAG: uroporphyrinogen decarboxylase [Eubacteriaceae bacterium]|nr:uroporphyrinogen decarboxylase [Eubacteriaceae bacterium]
MKKERVIHAINHKVTDKIPHTIEFTLDELTVLCDALKMSSEEIFDFADNHMEKINLNAGGIWIKEGFYQDEFGVLWDRTGHDKDIGVPSEILFKEPDIKLYEFPPVNETAVRAEFDKILNNGRDTFKIPKISYNLFERAWSLRGMQNILMDMMENPEFVEELFEKIFEFNMIRINIALEYDIDGVYFGDDYGQQKGLIMGPKLWRQYIKPVLSRQYEAVKKAGKFVMQHSCGDNWSILPDFIEMGLDVYNTVQPEIYDLHKLKSEFGKDLAFWGGISNQRLLPFATPEEVKRVTKETMNILGEGGGYICSPTHRMPQDVPVENFLALVDVFKNQ